jgi:transposase
MTEQTTQIILGVDTHTDTHAAVAIDTVGKRLGHIEIQANPAGYRALLEWVHPLGVLSSVGVEGTGSYGAVLSRFLTAAGVTVIEVGRVNRQHRRRYGKSDPADAEAAARAVLSGQETSVPKSRDGIVESIRTLHVVKRSAIKARTQAANQMTALIVTAPEQTRGELRGLTALRRARLAAKWRPGTGHDPATVTRRAIRALARRWLDLTEEINTHNGSEPKPVSPPSAASTPSKHPQAKPVATDSTAPGTAKQTTPCGSLRWFASAEGLTHREIVRCLKRYMARRLYPILIKNLAALT